MGTSSVEKQLYSLSSILQGVSRVVESVQQRYGSNLPAGTVIHRRGLTKSKRIKNFLRFIDDEVKNNSNLQLALGAILMETAYTAATGTLGSSASSGDYNAYKLLQIAYERLKTGDVTRLNDDVSNLLHLIGYGDRIKEVIASLPKRVLRGE